MLDCYNKGSYNRSYMKALRDLLCQRQWHLANLLREDFNIRESMISKIEQKWASQDLIDRYAEIMAKLIEESEHEEAVKDIMRSLLKVWKEA